MRIGRLLTVLLTTSLLGSGVVVLGAPAATAAETFATRTVIEPEKNRMRYGDTFDVAGQVVATAPDGNEYGVEEAPMALQRRFPGKAWKTIRRATGNSINGVVTFADVRGSQNAAYRIRYAGGTRTYDGAEVTFGASTSKARSVRVARDITMAGEKRSGRMYVFGKVRPTFKHKVVQIQRKTCSTCRWAVWKKVRTNHLSRYRTAVAVPRSGTWFYRAYTPRTTRFIASPSRNGWKVWRL